MHRPAFVRPPAADTGEQARRAAFDALAARRCANLTGEGRDDDGQLLDALVRGFADTVDRANSSRAILRQTPIEYVDAVVVDGSQGQLVIDAPEYDAAPVYWQARAGEVTSVVHGADLDAYLRTGERRYAERIGLA